MYARNAGYLDYPALSPETEARLDRIERQAMADSRLITAIHDRRERAVTVETTYRIEFVGCQAWVVQHPEEAERCYLVDMIARQCSCPDSAMCRIKGKQIDCKHILAVVPLWEKLTGRKLERQERPPEQPLPKGPKRPIARPQPLSGARIWAEHRNWRSGERRSSLIVGSFPRSKVKNCQLRWIGGEWDSPAATTATHQGMKFKVRKQSRGWLFSYTREAVNKILAVYPDVEIDRDITDSLGPFEPCTEEIGYDFGPMVAFRGEPSIEEIRAWHGGDAMADWIERQQAIRRVEHDEYRKTHPLKEVKHAIIGADGKIVNDDPDPFRD